MEFDPGHTAFSYPRRPCKLDRSFSWTGTTKSSYSDMLGNSASQYALTDLDCDYGYHNQAMDFLDVPSMFEDALRQLASTPGFALSPVPPQTGNPLAATIPETRPQHAVETGIDTLHLDISNDEGFFDNIVSLSEFEQDFPSNQWLFPLANNYTVSEPTMDSSAGASSATSNFPGLQIDQNDAFVYPPYVTTPTDQQPRTTSLETIDEEVHYPIGNIARNEVSLIYSDSITGAEAFHSHDLSLDTPVHVVVNQKQMFSSVDESMLRQTLAPCPDPEVPTFPPATPNFQADAPSIVLAKFELEIHVDCHRPAAPPLPLNDLMSKFDSNPGALVQKRRRRRFTEDGKTKVKNVRETGACVFCRARKVSCTPKGACLACVKLACGSPVADHICVRSRLRDTFVGVRALHGSSFDHRKARLEPLLSSLTGRPMPVQFSVESYDDHDSVPFRNNDHHIRTLASLDIQVMQCSSSALCRWKKLTKVSGIYITSDIFDGQRYVIIPSSLPSIDEFDKFGRKILLASDGGHSGTITLLLDQFLGIYCSRNNNTDLRVLANLTSRIASLNNLVAYGFLNLRDGSYDLLEKYPPGDSHNERYISETVHDQIRLLAAEGLEPAENIVFSELDNINKHVSANEHARMIIGVCILRLMLLYRDRLVRDEIRLSLPRQKKWHQYRLERASFMYRRLTVAYSTLCREYDTPLTMEWEDEKDSGSFEGDQMLRNLYLQFQPAFRQFCNEKLSLQYDDVLKILLANPAKQQKVKKRRKTSR